MTAHHDKTTDDVLPINTQSDAAAVAAALIHHRDRFPSEFQNAADRVRKAATKAAHSPQQHGLEPDVDGDLPAVIDA